MARYPLFEALNPHEYRVLNNAAYGVMEEYPFMMVYVNSSTLRVSITTQSIDANAAKLVKGTLVGQGVKAQVNGRLVCFNAKVNKRSIPGDVLSRVQAVVSVLRQCGVAAPAHCILCGQSGHDAYMYYGGCYDGVHAACVTQLQSHAQTTAEENPGSYGKGVLGALIGAIVGAIPSILGLTALNIISAWLFMLIPIATYYGYKKLGGKMDRGATIISILLSVVGLGFTFVCWDVAVNIRWLAMDLGEAIGYTLGNMTMPGYWSWIGSDLSKIILFFVIGVLFSFAKIGRTNKTVVKSLEQTRQTLMHRQDGWKAPETTPPYTGYSEPAPVQTGKDDPWAINGLDKFK